MWLKGTVLTKHAHGLGFYPQSHKIQKLHFETLATNKPKMKVRKEYPIIRKNLARQWWHTPLISALGRQREEDLCEFEASLVYKASFRVARLLHRETLSQKIKK